MPCASTISTNGLTLSDRRNGLAALAARPAPGRVAGLDARRSPPDAFAVKGREVYLHLPNGTARSRLTNAWLDSALATTSTIRNWRTVLALLEMATVG